jgi:hypothetical protein
VIAFFSFHKHEPYVSKVLSEPANAPLASWICGWFNLLGQVAVTTGIR